MTFEDIIKFFRDSKAAIEYLKKDPNFVAGARSDEELIKNFKIQIFEKLKNSRQLVIDNYKNKLQDEINEHYVNIANFDEQINKITNNNEVPSAAKFLYGDSFQEEEEIGPEVSPDEKANALTSIVTEKMDEQEIVDKLEIKVNGEVGWDIAKQFKDSFDDLHNNNADPIGKALFVQGKESLLNGDLGDQFYEYDAVAMLEFYNNVIPNKQQLDSLFADIQVPQLSDVSTKYIETGKTGHEVVDIKDNPTSRIDIQIKNSFNADSKLLKSVLGGLDGSDGKEYTDRLGQICAILAYEKEGPTPSFLRFGLIETGDASDVKMAKYINNLISKGEAFADEADKYPLINVNDIAKSARVYREKYFDQKAIAADYKKLKTETKIFESDSYVCGNAFNDVESDADFRRVFDKLLNDTLDGKSGISKYDGRPLQRTAHNIGEVSTYIMQMYEKSENETLSMHGITPDFVTKTCYEALDSDIIANDFMQTFNTQLNRYNLAGADLVAYNRTAAERMEVDPKTGRKENEIAYQKALVQVEGLRCNGDDPKLTDAICTYARLKDVHDKRPWYFKFIHPINNYREGKTVESMEGILQHDFDITPQDLEAKVAEIKRSGLYYDSINKAAKVCEDKNSFDALETEAQERQSQRNAVINKQLKNLTKYGTRTVPESENPNLEKLTTNSRIKALKEVYVEKEYQYSSFESEFKGKDIEAVLKDFESEIAQVTTMKSDSELKKYILSNNINCLKDLNEDDIRALKANNPDIYPKSMSSDEVKKIYSKGQNLLSQEKINELRENNPAYKECSDERIQMLYSVQGHMRTKSTANIEKFIDWDGYNKDDIDKSVDLQNEVKIRREFLGKENPSQEERALFDKQMKYFDEKKQLYEINRQERVENFYLKYDEFMAQKDLAAINNATGQEKESLEAQYENDKKQRENFKKEVAERQIKHEEKKQSLKVEIEKVNEEIELAKAYKETAIKSKDDSVIDKPINKDFNKLLGQDSQIINVEKNDVAKKVENKPQVKEIEPLKKDK